MAKRALVGSFVAGSTGAIVGMATTTPNSEVKVECSSDPVRLDLWLVVRTDNIKRPIVKTPLGRKIDVAKEVAAVMQLVLIEIEREKQSRMYNL